MSWALGFVVFTWVCAPFVLTYFVWRERRDSDISIGVFFTMAGVALLPFMQQAMLLMALTSDLQNGWTKRIMFKKRSSK